MRHGRSHGSRASRRLVAVLSGALATTVALAAALSTGADARIQTAPTNTALPAIAGSPVAGQTLTASPGNWDGSTPLTYAYQWQRCDADGNNCTDIAGETSNHRQLVSDDLGHRLRVKVKATNSDGSATATSNATAVVTSAASAPPVNTTEPTVSGSTVQGQTLAGTSGSWSGATPITFQYQWLRCDSSGNTCSAITGETSQSRTLVADDVGHRLRIRVTATNSYGTTSAQSNATSTVTASGGGSGPPVNTALPAVSGTATQGQALTSTSGTWTGAATITFAYQWLRCDAAGNNCATITGETSQSRTLVADDVGHRLRIRVTATNSSGASSVQSDPTAVVSASSGGGGGGGGGPLPDGAVQLPSGKYSIPVTSVSLPTQLVVDKVKFTPNPVRSRTEPVIVRVHVVDTRGYVVRDALVFVRTVPLLTTTPPESPTGQDGWASLQMFPRPDFPLRNRHFVQVFVRVRKSGDTLLAGVGTRRLVQVRTAQPS